MHPTLKLVFLSLTRVLFCAARQAIAHCHERGICHRDIALGNLLLDSHDLEHAHIKLIDFGKACFFREADVQRYSGSDSQNLAREMSRCVGTLYSCAPEVVWVVFCTGADPARRREPVPATRRSSPRAATLS